MKRCDLARAGAVSVLLSMAWTLGPTGVGAQTAYDPMQPPQAVPPPGGEDAGSPEGG